MLSAAIEGHDCGLARGPEFTCRSAKENWYIVFTEKHFPT